MYYTVAMVAVKAISFIYFTIIARSIGVEGTGKYFLAIAITMVFQAVTDFGLTSVVIREVAKAKEDAKDWVQNVIGLKLFFVPLAAVLTYFTPIVLHYDADVIKLVHIATLVMIADAVTATCFGVMRGLQNLKYESVGIFIGQLLTLAAGLILIATDSITLPLLILALLVGSVWNMFFSAVQIVRHLGWGALAPKLKMSKKVLSMSFAFFLAAIFVKVYSYVDSMILSKVVGDVAVGEYAVAYKLTYAFQFLPLAFVAALYPTMSAQSEDEKALKQTLLSAFWYMALLGFPIVFGIWSIAPEIIQAFYGEEFLNAILPLQVLVFGLIPIFLDFPVGSLLNATNRHYIKTGIMGVTMIINIIINLLLIPKYGTLGASIAALASFSFMFVSGWLFAKNAINLSFKDIFQKTGGLFLAAVLMALAVFIVKPYVHFSLAVPVGAIVYIASAFLFKALTLEHFKTFKYLISKKAGYVEENITSNA